ncbi:phytanoyl-CoA dioxygenase family protein [Dactylosporangium sp. NPDC049525]|uniref:phytanoyl-CoA dioxygenase family protein n=1 Tax=Dactylosporangium sp. NPDC049525 TaxID=3154730 RepID=UPI00343A8075
MTISTELDRHYAVSLDDVDRYAADGYVKLRGVLSADVVAHYEPEITEQVIRLNTQHLPLSERDTYSRAFLQVGNLWRHSEKVREFAFSRRMAGIAAQLLQVPAVRLYHDQALYKEAGGGFTPWHVDQHYWPLSTDRTVTVWIPLQDTPMELGPLTFAAGSHRSGYGREMEISDESEAQLNAFVAEAGYRVDDSPFAVGDVSFHSGWTIHRAPGNTSATPRRVMTVIYMDAAIRVARPTNRYQENDLAAWLDSRPVGRVADGPLNPVLWES